MRKVVIWTACCLALAAVCVSRNHAQEEAIAEAVVEPQKTDAKRPTPTIRPLTVTTGLTDDTMITGTLLDSTSIAVKTAFGEAAIPLSEVAGIRFPSAEDTSTTIVMLNGDSITGATDVKFVSVQTTWGNAKINGQSVSTMLFVPGLVWQSVESLGGKRWSLSEKPATPPQAAPQQQAAQNQGFARPGQPQVIFGR